MRSKLTAEENRELLNRLLRPVSILPTGLLQQPNRELTRDEFIHRLNIFKDKELRAFARENNIRLRSGKNGDRKADVIDKIVAAIESKSDFHSFNDVLKSLNEFKNQISKTSSLNINEQPQASNPSHDRPSSPPRYSKGKEEVSPKNSPRPARHSKGKEEVSPENSPRPTRITVQEIYEPYSSFLPDSVIRRKVYKKYGQKGLDILDDLISRHKFTQEDLNNLTENSNPDDKPFYEELEEYSRLTITKHTVRIPGDEIGFQELKEGILKYIKQKGWTDRPDIQYSLQLKYIDTDPKITKNREKWIVVTGEIDEKVLTLDNFIDFVQSDKLFRFTQKETAGNYFVSGGQAYPTYILDPTEFMITSIQIPGGGGLDSRGKKKGTYSPKIFPIYNRVLTYNNVKDGDCLLMCLIQEMKKYKQQDVVSDHDEINEFFNKYKNTQTVIPPTQTRSIRKKLGSKLPAGPISTSCVSIIEDEYRINIDVYLPVKTGWNVDNVYKVIETCDEEGATKPEHCRTIVKVDLPMAYEREEDRYENTLSVLLADNHYYHIPDIETIRSPRGLCPQCGRLICNQEKSCWAFLSGSNRINKRQTEAVPKKPTIRIDSSMSIIEGYDGELIADKFAMMYSNKIVEGESIHQMLNKLMTTRFGGNVVLSTFNGSDVYNYFYLKGLMNMGLVPTKDQIFYAGNRILQLRTQHFRCWDPYAFLPYDIYKTAEVMGEKLIKLSVDDSEKNVKEHLIFSNKATNELISIIKKLLNRDPLNYMTLPQLAYWTWLETVNKQWIIPAQTEEMYNYIHSAMVGGRIQCPRGRGQFTLTDYPEGMCLLDCVSLYVHSMLNYLYPIGEIIETNVEIPGKLGIYTCIINQDNLDRDKKIIGIKNGEVRNYCPQGDTETTITTPEIELLRKYECKVIVKNGIYWDRSDNPFKELVKPLMDVKKTTQNALEKDITKKILVSIPGQLLRKPYKQGWAHAVDNSDVARFAKNHMNISADFIKTPNGAEPMIKLTGIKKRPFSPKKARMNYWGVFILAYARCYMYEQIPGKGIPWLLTAVDSALIPRRYLHLVNIGTEEGQFKPVVENGFNGNDIKEAIIIGNNWNYLVDREGNERKKHQGIPEKSEWYPIEDEDKIGTEQEIVYKGTNKEMYIYALKNRVLRFICHKIERKIAGDRENEPATIKVVKIVSDVNKYGNVIPNVSESETEDKGEEEEVQGDNNIDLEAMLL